MSSHVHFTTADVEALPDHLDDTRYELIDGELLMARQPQWEHQAVSLVLAAALREWSRRTGLGRTNIAPGVVFSSEDDVAPDVVWISREWQAGALRDGKLYAAPELVVEVLSPGATNERRDRDLKLKLYAREGVDAYWLVDWRVQTVAVHRRTEAGLALVATLATADDLTSPLQPGFRLPVRELWET